jgi:hypothetical protein
MKFLLPTDQAIYENIRQMSVCLTDITKIFREFAADDKDFEGYWLRAKEVAHKADLIAHRADSLLNQIFMIPLDREDIYRLVHELDDIIDLLENTIHGICLYEMSEKKDFVNVFAGFAAEATGKLNALIRECFEKPEYTDLIWRLICDLHSLEDKGELAYDKGLRELFAGEADPITVIEWKDILYNLERIMNIFRKAGNTIEALAVKRG